MSEREHLYPPHLPKDSERTSVRIAWEILDQVRPGVLPLITRFRLASQIARAIESIDDIQQLAARAVQLRDFLTSNPKVLADIMAVSTDELALHLTRLSLVAATNNNKDK